MQAIIFILFSMLANVFVSLIMAIPVMLLWNAAIPSTFSGARGIDFWTALCLSLLCSILFKSSLTTRSQD